MNPSFPIQFPRLNDLYSVSTQGHPFNYFELPNVCAALECQHSHLVQLESVFQQMDPSSWNDFKIKIAPYVIAKNNWGWHSQLLDHFHEARAYAFLKTEGYSEIRFIDKTDKVTPDLFAVGSRGSALLEAKRINESNDESDYLMIPTDQKTCRKGSDTLSNPFISKLSSTISKATVQLTSFNKGTVDRRIMYLAVRLDLTHANQQASDELACFLRNLSPERVEIVHYLENEFLI